VDNRPTGSAFPVGDAELLERRIYLFDIGPGKSLLILAAALCPRQLLKLASDLDFGIDPDGARTLGN
jgi:hypothetical protein